MSHLILNPSPLAGQHTLVLMLLDGGLDGLYAVPPYADPDLRQQRPSLTLPDPGRSGGVIDLDGFFGLHPLLAPLEELYRAGHLAIVHACGSPDQTLSHFEASLTMQTGAADSRSLPDGWLARYLKCTAADQDGQFAGRTLRAVAIGHSLPPVLNGTLEAAALMSLSEFRLEIPSAWSSGWEQALMQLHQVGNLMPTQYGRNTLELMHQLRALKQRADPLGNRNDYGNSTLGRELSEIANLIRADIGLEVAVVRQSGWDSHQQQQASLQELLSSLARALRGFHDDLGEHIGNVTLVAMTEFGRRVKVNLAGGTDHGRGTAMFLLSGSLLGGRVYGRWPGLKSQNLDTNGNLEVTTSFRDVLAEICLRQLGIQQVDQVFPDFVPQFVNCCKTATS